MKYVYSRKPSRCPNCNKGSVAEILYGMPDFSNEKLKKDMDEGRVVLGGCVITDDDPCWQCTSCEVYIFKKQEGL